uniref:Uncharacterized protein n=1 Tax=Coccidioides posadasii RMSCC 3488 TaxID=454284 RepID=A0A0J6FN64_COCPO|nr:hypothetical protein CPAG_07199 [Coccidioides posadasii RMSCC 3488]
MFANDHFWLISNFRTKNEFTGEKEGRNNNHVQGNADYFVKKCVGTRGPFAHASHRRKTIPYVPKQSTSPGLTKLPILTHKAKCKKQWNKPPKCTSSRTPPT